MYINRTYCKYFSYTHRSWGAPSTFHCLQELASWSTILKQRLVATLLQVSTAVLSSALGSIGSNLAMLKWSEMKEISHKSFVFKLQSFIFQGSLAEKLRFFNFEGNLAEKLRFWPSKFQFWRKSRRKASVLLACACFTRCFAMCQWNCAVC